MIGTSFAEPDAKTGRDARIAAGKDFSCPWEWDKACSGKAYKTSGQFPGRSILIVSVDISITSHEFGSIRSKIVVI
jgi:hypothetical protein